MSLYKGAWIVVAVSLGGLAACGPDHAAQPPEGWFLGEWFMGWSELCPEQCTPEILTQVEVEPDGTGVLHREAICFDDYRKELTWVEEEPELLLFTPVEPDIVGLEVSDLESFRLRYENHCDAVGEEAMKEHPLRRGPVKLAPPPNEHDCDGFIVPDTEVSDDACLDG